MLPPALWWLEESGPARWEGLDMARLRMDQAYVRVHNEAEEDPLWLYSLSEDCQDCPYRRWSDVSGEGPHVLTVDTARTSTWRVYTNGDNATVPEDDTRWASCEVPAALGEFGVYDLHVNGSDCMLRTARQPANVLFPRRRQRVQGAAQRQRPQAAGPGLAVGVAVALVVARALRGARAHPRPPEGAVRGRGPGHQHRAHDVREPRRGRLLVPGPRHLGRPVRRRPGVPLVPVDHGRVHPAVGAAAARPRRQPLPPAARRLQAVPGAVRARRGPLLAVVQPPRVPARDGRAAAAGRRLPGGGLAGRAHDPPALGRGRGGHGRGPQGPVPGRAGRRAGAAAAVGRGAGARRPARARLPAAGRPRLPARLHGPRRRAPGRRAPQLHRRRGRLRGQARPRRGAPLPDARLARRVRLGAVRPGGSAGLPEQRAAGVPGRAGGQRARHLLVVAGAPGALVRLGRAAGRGGRVRLVLRRRARQQVPVDGALRAAHLQPGPGAALRLLPARRRVALLDRLALPVPGHERPRHVRGPPAVLPAVPLPLAARAHEHAPHAAAGERVGHAAVDPGGRLPVPPESVHLGVTLVCSSVLTRVLKCMCSLCK